MVKVTLTRNAAAKVANTLWASGPCIKNIPGSRHQRDPGVTSSVSLLSSGELNSVTTKEQTSQAACQHREMNGSSVNPVCRFIPIDSATSRA